MTSNKRANWNDLDGWFKEQEHHFLQNKIDNDESKIKHLILYIDVII